MTLLHHLDLAKLCSLSYQEPKKCSQIPIFLESNCDCEVYICDYQDTITVCFRGTESYTDILIDLKILQVKFVIPGIENEDYPQVHSGFNQQFESVKQRIQLKIDELLDINDKHNKNKKVIFTGHSLGGALATLSSLYFKITNPKLDISCITFGSPRVGDFKFVKLYEKYIKESHRYVNDNDPVPCIPTSWRFQHVPGLIWLNEDKIQHEITVWRFYRFMKNTMMSWFGYGYNALEDHSCDSYVKDLSVLGDIFGEILF